MIFVCTILFFLLLDNVFSKKYIIKKSTINGLGVFADKNIKKDEYIDFAFILYNNNKSGKVSYFGSKINHCSKNDNSYLKKSGNYYYLYAKKNIRKGDEITSNYNNTPKIIQKPNKNYKKC